MKAILILCLLATLNCNFLSTLFCVIGNEKIRAFATEVITKIKNKDWANLPLLLLNNFNQLKDVVVSCIGQKEEEVVLKQNLGDRIASCANSCRNARPEDYNDCVNYCVKHSG